MDLLNWFRNRKVPRQALSASDVSEAVVSSAGRTKYDVLLDSRANGVDEFRAWVLDAYRSLLEDGDYMELPCRPERYANPFSVRLGNSTTVIEIEGVSYGMGASTKVFHAEDADDDWYGLPVWKLMPKLAPEGNTKSRQLLGQREQILRQAADLMEYARDVLSGDFKVLDAIVDHQRQLDEERLARAPSRAQRAANVAVSEAGHAFKRGEYSTVVRLLEPHLALLTPSQKRRYDIARERSVNA